MSAPAYTLVLLRHGHSEWNLSSRFTGWTDIPLTDVGLQEAVVAGHSLARRGLFFDEVHMSVLHRSQQTYDALTTAAAEHAGIPAFTTWRLNERHYGQLQGMNKEEIFASWGKERSRRWWRGYVDAPPALEMDDPRHPRFDPLYQDLDATLLPCSESLAQCRARVVPYWDDVIVPKIRTGKRLLIISHGNTLRSLCMHVENISSQDIERLEIPSGVPIVYEFDSDMKFIASECLVL